jgi:hypothetical protein
MYRSSYMVDYEAPIKLTPVGTTQHSIWPTTPQAWTIPLTPRRLYSLGPST